MAHNSYLTSNAIIINNIPLTTIKDIQSIVFYNRVVRTSQSFLDRALDLTIECYDSRNDPDFTNILATTNIISVGSLVYRFDFPEISTYTTFSTSNSITQIIDEASATTENAILNTDDLLTNIKGDVVINGTLTLDYGANSLVVSGNQINFNSDSFISNTSGGTSGNHLVIFINGTEYKIKLENAS